MSQTRIFFEKLFGAVEDHDAHAVVFALPSKERCAIPVHNLDALVEAAKEIDAPEGDDKPENAYYGVSLVGKDFDVDKGRGDREALRYGVALFVDVDTQGIGHAAKNLPPTIKDALSVIAEVVPFDPNIVVSTGAGCHVYFTLKNPIAFGERGALSPAGKRYEAVLKAFQGKIRVAFAARGWLLDDTADATRVLRVPGTHNRKVPGKPRLSTLLDADDGRTEFDAVEKWVGLSPSPMENVVPAFAPTATPAPPVPAPPRAPFDRNVFLGKLRAIKKPEHATLIAKVLTGQSFADTERDAAMQRVASIFAFVEPDADPSLLAEVMCESLCAWSSETTATKTLEEELAKAAEKIGRAQVDARRKREEREERDARLSRAMTASLRQRFPEEPVEPPDPLILPSEEVRAPVKPRTLSTGAKYSTDDLKFFAALQGCSVADFQRRWIIQAKNSYYFFVEGVYQAPVGMPEFWTIARDAFARAPVEIFVPTKKGDGMRRMDVQEFLDRYATGALAVEASLSANLSYFNARTKKFTEAVCPVRAELVPRFNQDVQDWLEKLGGLESKKLLDWCASVTRLRHQCCAIYFTGPPETGKSLFTQGVADIWRKAGPVSIKNMFGAFNRELTACPLIVADEKIETGSTFRVITSADLRNFVGVTSRTLNQKFLPETSLTGNLRFIFAANNEMLLQFNEERTSEDNAATAARFLQVDTSGAVDYFKKRFADGHAPASWHNEGDAIAEHCLWLRDNRTVIPEGRWLVKGSVKNMHRMMALSGRVPQLVVEWLSKFLSAPDAKRRQVMQDKKILVGNGRLLVNTEAITSNWKAFITSDNVPGTGQVGKALLGMKISDEQVAVGKLRYHYIDPEYPLGWAYQNGIGEDESMRALVNAPYPAAPASSPAPTTPQKKDGEL